MNFIDFKMKFSNKIYNKNNLDYIKTIRNGNKINNNNNIFQKPN